MRLPQQDEGQAALDFDVIPQSPFQMFCSIFSVTLKVARV